MSKKSTGSSMDQLDRDIQIHKDVYALALCVLEGNPQKAVRASLQEMHGMDWVAVPYSLSRAMQDAITLAVMRRLPYLAGQLLVELDEDKGELRLTKLGQMSVNKLRPKIAHLI
jgi:hypothetical protein